jgi:hypothetical protein
MSRDRQIITAGGWAIAADRVQWILQRQRGGRWMPVVFVHTGKDILARCMRDKGVPAEAAARLLAALPEQFQATVEKPLEACRIDLQRLAVSELSRGGITAPSSLAA